MDQTSNLEASDKFNIWVILHILTLKFISIFTIDSIYFKKYIPHR